MSNAAQVSGTPVWDRETFGLLTEEELAKILGVEELTLSKWRREGRSPVYVMPGKTVFYRRWDVEAWLVNIAQHPGSQPAQAA